MTNRNYTSEYGDEQALREIYSKPLNIAPLQHPLIERQRVLQTLLVKAQERYDQDSIEDVEQKLALIAAEIEALGL